jgi:hypothetical protein
MDCLITQYMLEIVTHDVVYSACALTPFPDFRKGDIIDPGPWAEALMEKGSLEVTDVRYWTYLFKGNSESGESASNRVKTQVRCRIIP